MFGAIPFGSFRAAVWCCPSMHFVVRSCFRLHRLHSIRFARFRCFGFYICSNFASFAGVGYVVHHSVGKHVRLLLALGYDSLEYFIFYIPLNTLDLVTYLGQYSIFTFFFTKAREHPHTDFRPNPAVHH